MKRLLVMLVAVVGFGVAVVSVYAKGGVTKKNIQSIENVATNDVTMNCSEDNASVVYSEASSRPCDECTCCNTKLYSKATCFKKYTGTCRACEGKGCSNNSYCDNGRIFVWVSGCYCSKCGTCYRSCD